MSMSWLDLSELRACRARTVLSWSLRACVRGGSCGQTLMGRADEAVAQGMSPHRDAA